MRVARVCALLVFGIFAARVAVASQADPSAEIRGAVKDCWQGKVIPVTGITVYAYDMEEGKPVFEVLEKTRQLPFDDSPEGWQRYFEKFNPLYDELIRLVETSHKQTLHTKTNQQGEFVISKLRAGREYLVLAIDPEVEDQFSYYEYIVTGKLKPGARAVKLWMDVGTEETCRDSGR